MIDPVIVFVFVGLFSPGPNVLMITASGARFGLRASLPHLFGIVIGVGIIAAATGVGIGAALALRPEVETALKLVAAGWILWMAWRLWQSSLSQVDAATRPMTLIEAIAFQAVNPKIWAVALAAASGYPSDLSPALEAIRLALTFSGLNLFVCLFWSWAGTLLALLLNKAEAWATFARVMSVLLALSAVMVFL
ncbi:MAG: LysE family translocator [Pseudomonadota bacterium]